MDDVHITNLNDACPKDYFPLSRIDILIDATAGHELLTFVDDLSEYNLIHMDEYNIPKVTFVTNLYLYCYFILTFGLKMLVLPTKG